MSSAGKLCAILLLMIGVGSASQANAQGTAADYERANGLKAKYEAAAIDIAGVPSWIGDTHRFWYRKLSRGVSVYMIYDADTQQKNAAFDHDKIAASLSRLTQNTYKSQDLNLGQLRFDNNLAWFSATVDGIAVRCTIVDSACSKFEPPARAQGPVKSPDGRWEAMIVNYNLAVRQVDTKEPIVLSTDGS